MASHLSPDPLDFQNRFKATLLGGAIGDSLGMPVEGWPRERIRKYVGRIDDLLDPVIIKAGNKIVTQDEFGRIKYWTKDLKKGMFTDDTILSLALAESLAKYGLDFEQIAKGQLDAYLSQPLISRDGRQVHSSAFGKTTTDAFERLQSGIPYNLSGIIGGPGNAPSMKMAPLGLYMAALEYNSRNSLPPMSRTLPKKFTEIICSRNPSSRNPNQRIYENSDQTLLEKNLETHTASSEKKSQSIKQVPGLEAATIISKMTHLDPRSVAGGVVQAAAINILIINPEISKHEFLNYIVDICAMYEEPVHDTHTLWEEGSLFHRLEWIQSHPEEKEDFAFSYLGASSKVYQSYPFAIFMFQRCWDDPLEGLLKTINYGGDCDTTGAILGSLIGAKHGMIFLDRWINQLSQHDKIIDIAAKLLNANNF